MIISVRKPIYFLYLGVWFCKLGKFSIIIYHKRSSNSFFPHLWKFIKPIFLIFWRYSINLEPYLIFSFFFFFCLRYSKNLSSSSDIFFSASPRPFLILSFVFPRWLNYSFLLFQVSLFGHIWTFFGIYLWFTVW